MADRRPESDGKPVPLLERTPVLEWITAAVGLALVLGALGFLIWEGLQAQGQSPQLAVRAGIVTPTPHGYVVQIEVRNESHVTASGVEIEGVLSGRSGEEKAAVTFDYVPGLSRREGSLTFREDPRRGPLTLQVRGQIDP